MKQDTLETTIPESQLIKIQEEALRGKQELLDRLEHAQQEMRNLDVSSLAQVFILRYSIKNVQECIESVAVLVFLLLLHVAPVPCFDFQGYMRKYFIMLLLFVECSSLETDSDGGINGLTVA